MLKNDAIHNSLFRFQNIDLNNINDIYFAINIIIIIATTFFKNFIAVAFILKLVIIIVIIVIKVSVIIALIVISEKSVLKFVTFDFDIKRRFAINAPLDKFKNLTIIETFDNVFLRIDDDILLL